jgi:hypothetical protein
MRRNRFEFLRGSGLLTAEGAWQVFVDAVREHAPADRLATVTHRELLADPARMLARILSWLGPGDQPHRRAGRTAGAHRAAGYPGTRYIQAGSRDDVRENRDYWHGARRDGDA